jgi:hypothetical protein
MQQVQQMQHRKSSRAAAAALYTPVTELDLVLHAAPCSKAAQVLCILFFRKDTSICGFRYIGARKPKNGLAKCCGINAEL